MGARRKTHKQKSKTRAKTQGKGPPNPSPSPTGAEIYWSQTSQTGSQEGGFRQRNPHPFLPQAFTPLRSRWPAVGKHRLTGAPRDPGLISALLRPVVELRAPLVPPTCSCMPPHPTHTHWVESKPANPTQSIRTEARNRTQGQRLRCWEMWLKLAAHFSDGPGAQSLPCLSFTTSLFPGILLGPQ